MLKANWTLRGRVTKPEHITQLILDANECRPHISGFDTETTGLHIIIDNPFLIQFGFVNVKTKKGFTYLIDLERQSKHLITRFMDTIFKISERTKYFIGQNIKYDLHMFRNAGYEYPHTNVCELQVLMRLTTVALPVKKGGERLGLKPFAAKYVEKEARLYEEKVDTEKAKLVTQYNNELKSELKKIGLNWTPVKELLKDSINKLEDLGPDFCKVYYEWYNKLPELITRKMSEHTVTKDDIPYSFIDRDIMCEYAEYDVVYTLEIAMLLLPSIKVMKQERTLQRENDLILPLYRMEQMGFQMNLEYIKESEVSVREYIVQQRKELEDLAGFKLSCNQNSEIKRILNETYHTYPDSVDKDSLDEIQTEFNKSKNEQGARFISLIKELRTLEKWYKTYLLRFIKEASYIDTVYTQINQALPVTGRLSSNFQQFPKGSIYKEDGSELFIPRKMVSIPDGYAGLAFLDYSQIELRFQALYTILIGKPDTNLCRAYMPFNCYRLDLMNNQIKFDYNNENDVKRYKDYVWYTVEDDVEWHPTDVHAATTKEAFPDLEPTSKEFGTMRGIVGKRTNFAKNYGAQRAVTESLLYSLKEFNFTEEDVDRVDGAYYKAFPGVKEYHKYCYLIAKKGFMTNLFGRRYIKISGHNGINALIQGSAADFLKEAIIKLDAFIIENNLKTRMVINIHDEIAFAVYMGEERYVLEFRDIMEHFEKTKIPIVADMEYTVTTWDEKEDVTCAEDIIALNGNESSSNPRYATN